MYSVVGTMCTNVDDETATNDDVFCLLQCECVVLDVTTMSDVGE
jgi:hypothetical protein